jgi:hypothetical protein
MIQSVPAMMTWNGSPALMTWIRGGTDPSAVADEVRWQWSHTSPTVRDVLRRLPPPTRPAGMLGALISDIHTKLSGGE